MAIKDQCSQCKSCHEGLCKLQSSLPVYDQTSCSQYIKKGIDLDKYEGQVNHNENFENGDTAPSHQTDIHRKQKMFQHPFSFKGRIRRLEYGLSYLLMYDLFLPINITPENQVSEVWQYSILYCSSRHYGLCGLKVQNVVTIEVILDGIR